MLNSSPKLFLFPGLGADHRLFSQMDLGRFQITTPQWLTPNPDESLAQYGARWAKNLPIRSQDALGGMSFGGQLALEIAKHVEARALFLISANRRGEEISSQFRMQNSLLQNLPESMVRQGLKSIAIPKLSKEEKLQKDQVQMLQLMLEDMDFDFFKWASNAAAKWDYQFKAEDFKMPIYQIHGEHDSIIRRSKDSCVKILQSAGHLINYTHSKEVSQWIKEGLQDSY